MNTVFVLFGERSVGDEKVNIFLGVFKHRDDAIVAFVSVSRDYDGYTIMNERVW